MAVRIKTSPLEQISEIMQGKIIEVTIAPELRSTTATWEADQINSRVGSVVLIID